jgi:hypothetical protein
MNDVTFTREFALFDRGGEKGLRIVGFTLFTDSHVNK